MSKFAYPARFDKDVAENGVWIDLVAENGAEYGRFKCQLLDLENNRTKVMLERLKRKYSAKVNQTKTADDDAALIDLFVEASLVDWEVKDSKGKAVPFSKDDAYDYFRAEAGKWPFGKCWDIATDVKNYQAELAEGFVPIDAKAEQGN